MNDRAASYVADVREWTRRAFALDPRVAVQVIEEDVEHADGARTETLIVIERATGREEHRLHIPVDRVSPAHLWQLAAGDHGCCR
ncbi:MAG: hypothetical protein ACKO91_02160 [Acidimicrobiales bacterium]